jgi:hypothetical protein
LAASGAAAEAAASGPAAEAAQELEQVVEGLHVHILGHGAKHCRRCVCPFTLNMDTGQHLQPPPELWELCAIGLRAR